MARASKHTSSHADTPLRQAPRAIPATLEAVCADLDKNAHDGSSGVTPSMLSGWELGRHTTSVKYRTLLAAYYAQPPEVLFAHQDAQLATADETPRLLVGHRDLRKAMIDVAERAEDYLAITGSRSRDIVYLKAIETVLAARPELVHYRVLFGPPRHSDLTERLLRLLDLRDPHDRSLGVKTLHIGLIADEPNTPERFFCASEHVAVVPIPSLTSAEAFDSGVLLGAAAAERLIDHARQCYAAARRVETPPLCTRCLRRDGPTSTRARRAGVTMSPHHRHDGADHARIVAAAKEDHESVLELTTALVRIPSRAGIDPYDPIIEPLSAWMRDHDLPTDPSGCSNSTTVAPAGVCADPTLSATEICTTNPHGTDGSCFADSDGPAIALLDGIAQLVDGASRATGQYCGTTGTVYTSSPEFRDWIYGVRADGERVAAGPR